MYQYEVLYVSKLPFIKHEILILPSGRATHNHPDSDVTVESAKKAIGDRKIVDRKFIHSRLSERELIARAHALSESRNYGIKYNCEDYIAELLGRHPKSKQRDKWLVLGLIGFGLLATR